MDVHKLVDKIVNILYTYIKKINNNNNKAELKCEEINWFFLFGSQVILGVK